MSRTVKTALAAAFAMIAGPSFAQETHVFDGSALLTQIAAQTAAAQARLADKVLASADFRLAPKFAAVGLRGAAPSALFAAEMPMLKRQTMTAGR
jgi:glycerol-3-phosphate dehydrogenase